MVFLHEDALIRNFVLDNLRRECVFMIKADDRQTSGLAPPWLAWRRHGADLWHVDMGCGHATTRMSTVLDDHHRG
jgi:hypothetical protein